MRYVDSDAIDIPGGIIITDPLVPTPVRDQPLMSTVPDPKFLSSIHSSAVLFGEPAHAISERRTFDGSAARIWDRGDITDIVRRSPKAYLWFIKDLVPYTFVGRTFMHGGDKNEYPRQTKFPTSPCSGVVGSCLYLHCATKCIQ